MLPSLHYDPASVYVRSSFPSPPFNPLSLPHPAPPTESLKLPGALLNTLNLNFAPLCDAIFKTLLTVSCSMSHFED